MLSPAKVGVELRSHGSHPPNLPAVVIGTAIGVDAISIVATGLACGLLYEFAAGTHVGTNAVLAASVLVATIFVLSMRAQGLYQTASMLRPVWQVKWVTIWWLAAFASTLSFAFLMNAEVNLSRGATGLFACLGYLVLVLNRVSWRFGIARALATGVIRRRTAAVISTSSWRQDAPEFGVLSSCGITVARHVVVEDIDCNASLAEALAELIASVRGSAIDEIVVALGSKDLHRLEAIVDGLHALPLPVRLLPDAPLSRVALQPVRSAGSLALVDIKREPLSGFERVAKRALDVAIATAALAALAPLLGLAMLAIRIETSGPVLFRQTRRGFNGRNFKILKLRSMTVAEDGARVMQATRFDPRVTRVGYWLRRTSIDELPQLWNVLRGEMSVIGPRPHAIAHDAYYDQLIENYAFRQHVKPGLTGWAQVKGLRGETPDVALMAARVDHDVWYIDNWSLILDIRIIVMTCFKLFPRTAY